MKDHQILTPLSRAEAWDLLESFRHLIGSSHNNLVIKEVAVGPFDDINKWIFLYHYKDYRCVEQAIKYYEGPYYDVLLLLEDQHAELTYKDLRSYIFEANPSTVVDEDATNSTLS